MKEKLIRFWSVKRNRILTIAGAAGVVVIAAAIILISILTIPETIPDDGVILAEAEEWEEIDSDGDGLLDEYELKVSKTNHKKADTDGDGVWDGDELYFGLDPLEPCSDGYTPDYRRTFTESAEAEGTTLTSTGDASVSSIYIEESEISLGRTPGVYSQVYELCQSHGSFDSATLSIGYDPEELEAEGITPEDLAIYQFLDDGTFSKVGGTVNADDQTVQVELEHFSRYFLADQTIVDEDVLTQVVILIDNSGSMYSKEVCPTSDENDLDFLRVDLAKQIVLSTGETYSFNIGRFAYNTTMMLDGFYSDKTGVCRKIDDIRTVKQTFDGTGIYHAVKAAADQFNNNEKGYRKFIILLTDGDTTESSWWYTVEDAIEAANNKNATVITIGLGEDVNETYLTKLAEQTGGTYIHATDAGALTRIEDILLSSLSFNLADLDDDGDKDAILVADSGFDILSDAFPFKNYNYTPSYDAQHVEGGQCAGIALFTEQYFNGTLSLTGEAIDSYRATGIARKAQYLEACAYNLTMLDFFTSETKQPLRNCYLDATFAALVKRGNENILDVYECDPENPSHLQYKQEIKDYIDSTPLISLYTIEVELSKVETNRGTYYYTSYDKYRYNLGNVNTDELTDEQIQTYYLLQALENLFAQNQDNYPEFEENKDIYKLNSDYVKDYNKNNFRSIVSIIGSGKIMSAHGSNHTVNLVRIYRSLKDPNIYYFEVYDNNNPYETRFLTVERKYYAALDLNISSWYNEYYFTMTDTEGIFGKAGKKVSVEFSITK